MNGKVIEAKFNSTCAETGKTIRKGDQVWYDFGQKKVYHTQSSRYQKEIEAAAVAQFIQDEQDAYFDNFCHANGI